MNYPHHENCDPHNSNPGADMKMHQSKVSEILAQSGGRPIHRVHAVAIVVLPMLAVFLALAMVFNGTVHIWHVALLVSMYGLSILGITVGFHRLLTHHAFQTGHITKAVLAIMGCMAAQGPPVYWVSNHRRHHRYVDRAGDPHSPTCDNDLKLGAWTGFWHAHAGWTFRHDLSNSVEHCPDLLRDATIRWVGRHYFKWVALAIVLPGLIGWLISGSVGGFFEGILWGGFLRLFFSYHMTNAINSAAHIWGYQRYDTGDSSRNNWRRLAQQPSRGRHGGRIFSRLV
jgi:stearoyl-CoA desaturase (delta-9 desaturase)